jgi:hypothetical protein
LRRISGTTSEMVNKESFFAAYKIRRIPICIGS